MIARGHPREGIADTIRTARVTITVAINRLVDEQLGAHRREDDNARRESSLARFPALISTTGVRGVTPASGGGSERAGAEIRGQGVGIGAGGVELGDDT